MFIARLVYWFFVAAFLSIVLAYGSFEIVAGRAPYLVPDLAAVAALAGALVLTCRRIHDLLAYERLAR